MKVKIKLISTLLLSFFAIINVYASDCEEELEPGRETKGKKQQQVQFTYEELRRPLEAHLQQNPALFNSSENKDIVVFLGKTGAGKSTLINYLSEKKLGVDEFGEIVLENPKDPTAMAIGGGKDAQTHLPQFVNVEGVAFYDLPGLDDTGGTVFELLNASFIKHVIENAKTTRLVVVAGSDEVTSNRGSSFKDLVSRIGRLLPATIDLGGCSACIITRSDQAEDQVIPYLKKKVDEGNLHPWIKSKAPRIGQMSKPRGGKIDLNERKSIMHTIMSAAPIKIRGINTEALYSLDVSSSLQGALKGEMELCLRNLERKIEGKIPEAKEGKMPLTLERFSEIIMPVTADIEPHSFQSNFKDEIASSELITLLRPFLSEIHYEQALSSIEKGPNLALARLRDKVRKFAETHPQVITEDQVIVTGNFSRVVREWYATAKISIGKTKIGIGPKRQEWSDGETRVRQKRNVEVYKTPPEGSGYYENPKGWPEIRSNGDWFNDGAPYEVETFRGEHR